MIKSDAWGKIISTDSASNAPYYALMANPLRYRGYIYDTETGFYYLQSRYYDPEVGRFINADGYVSTGTGFVGYNMYAYCNNNPVMGYDPTGNVNWWGVVAGVALAVIGVAVIIASDGIASPIGAALVLEAGALIAATGLITTQCAVDESAMVIDVAASDSNGSKNGTSVVIDFEKSTFDFYGHHGYTSSDQPTMTYSVGVVDNYEDIGDYAGPFVNGGITYNWIGADYCRSPDINPNSVSAKSITFSFFGSFEKKIKFYGGWDDYYHIGSFGG